MNEVARSVGMREMTCPNPECRSEQFVAISTWWKALENGQEVKRRARKCRKCGYADKETIPLPIRDRDAETASPGNSEPSEPDFVDPEANPP